MACFMLYLSHLCSVLLLNKCLTLDMSYRAERHCGGGKPDGIAYLRLDYYSVVISTGCSTTTPSRLKIHTHDQKGNWKKEGNEGI